MGMSSRTTSTSALARSLTAMADRASGISGFLATAGVVLLLATAAIVVGWQRWGRAVVTRPIYRIAVENIQVTAPPPWIRTDLRAEVVREGALNDLSIFDKDVTIRVYQAFELHPWVAKVKRVSKHPPARLEVDLDYRRPVAWVEVPPGVLPGDEWGVIPVDGNSVVLPTRGFTEENLADYPRITVPDVSPCGLAGTPWGDPRVAGAARLAALLEDRWKAWQLFRIRVLSESPGASSGRHATYAIETVGQRRIVWGCAPDLDLPGEPSAAKKLMRLQQLAERLGGSDQQPPQTTWDLRGS